MLGALAATACLAAACAPAFAPVPIGAGPAYQPAARWPLAGAAAYGGLRGEIAGGERMHLELFANGRVIVIPGGIGVSGGRTTRYGFITGALWHARAWTLQPGGVIHLARPGLRLRDVFEVWGQPLTADRLLSFSGRVRVYVAGERWHGDPGDLVLHDRDQVVLQVGPYVPPHPVFTFRPPAT